MDVAKISCWQELRSIAAEGAEEGNYHVSGPRRQHPVAGLPIEQRSDHRLHMDLGGGPAWRFEKLFMKFSWQYVRVVMLYPAMKTLLPSVGGSLRNDHTSMTTRLASRPPKISR